jgi:hypothetical protein
MAFWTCSIITTISALVSAGFSGGGLFGPSGGDIFERYAASRSIALLLAVLCCIGFRSREAIAALALVMSLVQGFDGLIGVLAHDPATSLGTSSSSLMICRQGNTVRGLSICSKVQPSPSSLTT